MKKQISILIISYSLLLTGCAGLLGEDQDLTGSNDRDPVLQIYLNDYIAAGKINQKEVSLPTYLSMKFVESFAQASQVGFCKITKSSSGRVRAEVEILKRAWDNYSNLDRRILIFHELTHCIQLRDHTDTWMTILEGHVVPKSMMNSYTLGSLYSSLRIKDLLPKYMSYYENELFNPSPKEVNKMATKMSQNIEQTINTDTGKRLEISRVEFATNKDHSCGSY